MEKEKFITLQWDMNHLASIDPKLYVSHIIPYAIGEGRPAPVSEATLSSGKDAMKFRKVDDFPADHIVLGYNVDFPRQGYCHLVYTWSIKDENVHCFDLRANQFTGRWQSEGEFEHWDDWKGVFTRTLFYRTGNSSHETEAYLSAIGYAGKGDFIPYDGRQYFDAGFRWTVELEGIPMMDAVDVVGEGHLEGCVISEDTVILSDVTEGLIRRLLRDDRVKSIWKDDIPITCEDDIGEVKSIY